MLTTPVPPVDELAGRTRLAVTRLARRIRQETADGMSPSMSAALATVERLGPLTPSELAEHERIQRPSATRIIAGLEKRGLVTRTPDERDRRCARIEVTPEGAHALDDVRRRRTAYLSRRLHGASEQDLAVLARAVEIIERMLEEDR